MSYVEEAAYGDLKALIRDIGIHPDNLALFKNFGDLQKEKDKLVNPLDTSYGYLMNGLFTPLDMTDYEDNFIGINEYPGLPPIQDTSRLRPYFDDATLPPLHSLATIEKIEERPMAARNRTHKDYLEAKKAAEDAGEEEDEETFGEEEEGEGEEGEEGEEGGEEAADYGEEVEDPDAWSTEEPVPDFAEYDNKIFLNESLRQRYNDLELDAFLKLLNVKPTSQWQDETMHHYKLGEHDYEDNA